MAGAFRRLADQIGSDLCSVLKKRAGNIAVAAYRHLELGDRMNHFSQLTCARCFFLGAALGVIFFGSVDRSEGSRWIRTRDGWERAELVLPVEARYEPSLHPWVVTALVALGSSLGLAAFARRRANGAQVERRLDDETYVGVGNWFQLESSAGREAVPGYHAAVRPACPVYAPPEENLRTF